MIAGAPNAGKSLIALNYALDAHIPTLYVSADTDAYTTAIRAAAHLTGHTVRGVEAAFQTEGGADFYEDQLRAVKNVRFDFYPSPTLDDIQLTVMAYAEAYGTYPELIIVDNLMNVVSLHENEWTGLRDIAKSMHHMARETDAAVFILHHTSENEGRPDTPPARKAIQGKVSQLPELILTVALVPSTGEFRVAAVKNRFGVNSPTGEDFITLWSDPSRMKIYGEKYKMHTATEWN
jgi:predicted ATP-dependent serine protease